MYNVNDGGGGYVVALCCVQGVGVPSKYSLILSDLMKAFARWGCHSKSRINLRTISRVSSLSTLAHS